MEGQRNIHRELLVCLLLAVVTAALFWPVRRHDFINYDDQHYVTKNPHVQAGLTKEGIGWAFGKLTGDNHTYWHPITWLSHMLDCELFHRADGTPDAGKHHLVNVFFHVLNTLLVFIVLTKLTGGVWRSAMVAALFAWHPLQVGTVAWIAERKNVLGTFFGLLAMLLYVFYAQRARSQTSSSKAGSWMYYILAIVLFALSLMCKPILITLPCVLLLIDFWPLRRVPSSKVLAHVHQVQSASSPHDEVNVMQRLVALLLEKLPFFALAAVSSWITIKSHQKLDLISSHFTWGQRLSNTVVGYWQYVRKTFWPNDLTVYYPMPDSWPLWMVLGAVIFLLVVSFLAIRYHRGRPYLFVGWFWFIGTLVPFIGLVQVNDQAMSDRFAYVPLIGFFVAMVWAGADWLWRSEKYIFARYLLPGVAAVGCLIVTRGELGHWRDSEALFRRALVVTKKNNIAHINLGEALERQGRLDEAMEQYAQSLQAKPGNSTAENNLGVALAKTGRLPEAMAHFEQAIRITPEDADAHCNLGLALSLQKKFDEAEKELKEALRHQPDHADAHNNLATILVQQGKLADSVPYFEAALRYKPSNVEAQNNLGYVLLKLGRTAEAATHFKEAVRFQPEHAQAHFNLGIILFKEQKLSEAIEHFRASVKARPDYAEAHYQLAEALQLEKKFSDAIYHLQEAERLRPEWGTKIEATLQVLRTGN